MMVKEGYKEVRVGPKNIKIPEEWGIKSLSSIGKLYAGGTPTRSKSSFYNGEIPWVKSGELNQNFIDNIEEKITKKGLKNSNAKLVPANRVLVAMYGATAGQVGFLRKKAATNQAVLAILPKDDSFYSLFFYYYLSHDMKRLVVQRQQGTGQQNLNKTLINDMEVIIPPLPEQKKIAEILLTVDEAIEKTDEVIEKTKRLKKGLMQKLLTKGIGHDEFKEVRIGPRKFEIPKAWEMKRLGELAKFKNGMNFSKEQKGDKGLLTVDVLNMYNNDNIYIDTDELYRVDVNLDKKEKYLLKENDVLFVRSSLKEGGVGWASLFKEQEEPVLFCGFIIRCRLKKNTNVYSPFLTYFLRTNFVRNKLIAGSGRVGITNISQKTLKILDVLLPPLKEQKKIASILSSVDEKIEKEKEYKEKLERLKKGLMQKLLTGEVRVNTDDIEEDKEA